MRHTTKPIFQLDPAIDSQDQTRIAYAQDCFIYTELLSSSTPSCDGPIINGTCSVCDAPTFHTPHLFLDEIIDCSSSNASLVYLLTTILKQWSALDLRLLGTIIRDEKPLTACQDIIHVYQHRHPLRLDPDDLASPWMSDTELIRELAPDVYCVAYRQWSWRESTPIHAGLIIGRVVAHLQLTAETLRKGHVNIRDQWILFPPENVRLPLAEHPSWSSAFDSALERYQQIVQEWEQEDMTNAGEDPDEDTADWSAYGERQEHTRPEEPQEHRHQWIIQRFPFLRLLNHPPSP